MNDEDQMPLIRRIMKLFVNATLASFGYEIRRRRTDREIDQKADGFPRYVNEAKKIGLDVNDWEEQKLGWDQALPILEQTTFPYLQKDSKVCEVGPGTGRFSRHIAARIPKGELHLVDRSPWMANFLRRYFQPNPIVSVHLNDGYSLPFAAESWMDLIFSGGTFIALKLGLFYLYSREFFRALKPGGYCVIEYIDITTPEAWDWLESQSKEYGNTYTYYAPEVVDRVFRSAGFEIVNHHQMGSRTYLVATKRGGGC